MVKFLDKNSGFNQWNARQQSGAGKSRFSGMLWWFVLFVAAWWLVGTFVAPKKHDASNTPAPVIEADVSAVPVSELDGEKITARVRGLRISDIDLKDFKREADGDAPMRLLPDEDAFAEIGMVARGTAAPTAETVWRASNGAQTWRNSDGVLFTRTVSADGYVITVIDEIKNNAKKDFAFAPYARIVRPADARASAGVYTGLVAYANGDVEHDDWRDLDKKPRAYTTGQGFTGFADQYWETLVAIDSPDQTIRAQKQGARYQTDASAAAVSVAPGATARITTHLYAGPRERDALGAASKLIAGANQTMDYGWFWFLARPMLWLLNAINAIVMNYGIAIIILTILLRMLLWPLTRKSYTSMIAMQKMQPEMARIQKLYANDKTRMQVEIMRLYQTHKTSPMSGCLPMLIQIPIFFALYKALLISVQMRNAHFLWISDLAAMDPYFIMPVLMGLTMWLQQYLQSASNKGATGDALAQTQKAMRWMPVLFTVLFAWMPAGLVLYWTVSNLFGIAQMYIIKRRMQK